MRLVTISGSLRHASTNTAALRSLEHHLARRYPDVKTLRSRIDDIPLFSEDIELTGWPGPVQRLRDAIASSDALLIATPEYNGSLPGALKNALDWLSRPHRTSPLSDKPVATMSASPAAFGAIRAQEHLRFVLQESGAELIHDSLVTLSRVDDLINDAGEIEEESAIARIRALADSIGSYLLDRYALNAVPSLETNGKAADSQVSK